MSKPENPYMYPHVEPGNYEQFHSGISLRDWFAGMTLASAAALPFGQGDYEHRAHVAYAQADAMLAERSKS